jgi:hypothetical protein
MKTKATKFGVMRVTFKDPDTLHDTVNEHVKATFGDLGLAEDEMGGEYLTVEIDIDAGTAKVIIEKD